MKLNIVKVLNEIASEEVSVNLLNDPDAWWNNTFNMRDLYDYEMGMIDMLNEQSFKMCDWLMKHGRNYDDVKFYDKPSYNEWFKDMNDYFVYKIAA